MTHISASRRQFLHSAVAGSLIFPGIVQQLLAESSEPLLPREPHFPAKAKHVIFLFMTGGVSHVDTFDPKPELHARPRQGDRSSTIPRSRIDPATSTFISSGRNGSSRRTAPAGTEVSTLFPHLAGCVDDIALIRSMHTSTRTTTTRR